MKNNSVQGKTDNTKDKAQENHVKMTQTPVPSLILRLSCSTIVSMLAGTTYNIVDMYFVSDLGNSAVAAVGVLFSVLAMIQAVGYTFGMGAGSRISRFLGEQKEQEAGRDALVAVLMSLPIFRIWEQASCGRNRWLIFWDRRIRSRHLH